jgi:hypothetical protein
MSSVPKAYQILWCPTMVLSLLAAYGGGSVNGKVYVSNICPPTIQRLMVRQKLLISLLRHTCGTMLTGLKITRLISSLKLNSPRIIRTTLPLELAHSLLILATIYALVLNHLPPMKVRLTRILKLPIRFLHGSNRLRNIYRTRLHGHRRIMRNMLINTARHTLNTVLAILSTLIQSTLRLSDQAAL